MKKIFVFFLFLFSLIGKGQEYTVTGKVTDGGEGLFGVTIKVEDTKYECKTNDKGEFLIKLPKGEYAVSIFLEGYLQQRMIWSVSRNTEMPNVELEEDIIQTKRGVVSLSDDEIDSEESSTEQVSGLLQASRDLYHQRASFDFNQVFYKVRGYDSKEAVTMLNGIPMTRIETGRAQWSNWGGLNDVTKNQIGTVGLGSSQYEFGGLFGSTNISMYPSENRKGLKVSTSASNRTYAGRVMATYNTGLNSNGLAFMVSASRRWTVSDSYIEGMPYNSYAFAAGVEYKPRLYYSASLTGLYSYNHRGKSAPLTQEAISLGGRHYNPNWGFLDGDVRNAKMKKVAEPIFILSNKYEKDGTKVAVNLGYQFGKQGDTRLQYIKSQNPDPTYYTNMPTYFYAHYKPTEPRLHDPFAYEKTLLQIDYFRQNPQLNWDKLYMANHMGGGESLYSINEDVIDTKTVSANVIFTQKITDNIHFNSAATYQNIKTDNYQEINDLLGGEYLLNKSYFSGYWYNAANERLKEGDKYQYFYNIRSQRANAFAQLVFRYGKAEFYVAGKFDHTGYERDGQFENNSVYVDSKGLSGYKYFNSTSTKAGVNYSITGRHILQFNTAYIENPQNVTSLFVNVRNSNSELPVELQSERQKSADASYIIRMPYFKSKLTGYVSKFENGVDKNYFFTQVRVGDESAGFLTETMAGIERMHYGVELGAEVQIIPVLKATAVASVNKYKYTDDAMLMYSSDKQLVSKPVTTYIKNYRVAAGPEQAYSLGLEYRSLSLWTIGITGNLLRKNYIEIAPMLRTSNIYLNPTTGSLYDNIDQAKVREMLEQEELGDLFLVNATVGKSWRIGGKYINFFLSANNLLNKQFKTGGFEQARKGDLQGMIADHSNGYPVFGNKYFVGLGFNYLANLSVSF